RFGHPGDHRNGAVRRQPRRVDAVLPELRQAIEKHLGDFDHIVPGRWLAARQHAHFDVLPERVLEDTVDLLERHVALAVAPLPVAAHLAPRVTHERAVEDQDRRMDWFEARHVGVDQVPGCAQRRLHQVLRGVSLCHLTLDFTRFRAQCKVAFVPNLFSAPVRGCGDVTPRRFVRVSLLVLFTYVFLANAWIGDDAHITFRSVWNFVHGYGLSYNPDERVQAYTHPLWMLTLAAAHFVTREFFFTVTAISYFFSVLAGVVVLRRAKTVGSAALTTVCLLSSKALIDYTASGLEYPLSYFLIALFYVNYFERRFDVPTPRELRFFTLIAALAFVNRADTSLLFVLPLAEITLWSLIARGRQTFRPLLVGALPAILWLAFATFYYGFPLPNTYYAKVANGIPAWLQHEQGWAYLFNSISHDPITLGTIALCLLFPVRVPGAMRRGAISAFLYVAYTVSSGGDFMGGRFFAMPFLVAVIGMVPDVERQLVPWLGGALILYNLLVPIVPIKTTATYDAAWPW